MMRAPSANTRRMGSADAHLDAEYQPQRDADNIIGIMLTAIIVSMSAAAKRARAASQSVTGAAVRLRRPAPLF